MKQIFGSTAALILIALLVLSAVLLILCLRYRKQALKLKELLNEKNQAVKEFEEERKALLDERTQLKKEVLLEANRKEELISQLGPHLIFNTLTCIESLIDTDPELASDALEIFSGYLRRSIDCLEHKEFVDISSELEFVENYLFLESLRFGDELDYFVVHAKKPFPVPSLILVPLVHLAIACDIRRTKTGKGMIEVDLDEDNTLLTIRIQDDCREDTGCMSDPEFLAGIERVKKRLRLMTGGYVLVKQIEDQGTEISVHIPKEKS